MTKSDYIRLILLISETVAEATDGIGTLKNISAELTNAAKKIATVVPRSSAQNDVGPK